jgi:beta-N-acetylhexosaminidase
MEGRPPPDDNPFEWTDSPPRSGRRYSERSFDTGESEPYETGERERHETGERERHETGERERHETGERERHETGERERWETGGRESFDPEPGPEDPYQSWQEGTEERLEDLVEREGFDSGEREAFETGERDPFDTGERERYGADESEAFDTGERETDRTRGRGWRGRRRGRGRRRDRLRSRADTGEYRSSGEREASRRHQHRRDLPASVRRRQAGAVVLVAAVLLIGGYVLASGGGGGGDGDGGVGLKRLVGQSIVARMDQGGPDKRLIRQARKGQIGGLFVSPDEGRGLAPRRVRRDIARVQKAARNGGNPPLLVMTDQEGGFVKRLQGPPDLAPNDLGESGDANVATVEGQKTGEFLAPLGFNVNLAPLLDVETERTADTIKSRTFSDDPAAVSAVGVGFIEGLESAGVSATAKHFPGLGLAPENTDFERVEISGSAADQEAALGPFQAAIDAGVDLVMMSSAIYPDLGSQEPAAFTPDIVQGQLRDQLGFEGLIITDDLEARAIADVADPRLAAVRALGAGNDLLLFAQTEGVSNRVLNILIKAIKGGRLLERGTVETAYDRIVAFKQTLGGQD